MRTQGQDMNADIPIATIANRLSGLTAVLAIFASINCYGSDREQAFNQLSAEFTTAMEKWADKLRHAEDDAEWIKVHKEYPIGKYAPRFLEIAETENHDRVGFESLKFVIGMESGIGTKDQEYYTFNQRAIELLLMHYRDRDLQPIFVKLSLSPQSENLLRTLSNDKNVPPLAARASFALGDLLARKRLLVIGKWRYDRDEPDQKLAYLGQRTWPNLLKYLDGADEQELYQQAEGYFERAIAISSKLPEDESMSKLADSAAKDLYELRHLSPGKPAIEIKGRDLAKNEMSLAEFQGKVVLLVFWASWCGPCVGDIPHEKKLFEQFAGRPFTIVGVNADDSREDALKIVREYNIPWRSFWNGNHTTTASITSNWNVRAWPTIYVIDHRGMIKYKNIHVEILDRKLEQLIELAEKDNSEKNKSE